MTYNIFFSDLSEDNQQKIIETVSKEVKEASDSEEAIDCERLALIKINAQFPITIKI